MPALDRLAPGQSARVVAVAGDPAVVQRLSEMGLLDGETVEFVARAPLGDPIEVRVGNTRLSLRAAEAAGIQVEPL